MEEVKDQIKGREGLHAKDSDSIISMENNGDENKERGNWTNPLDFVLSLVGYAVGLSNIWRFPYLCMRNGGGAFLIPYFTFLFLVGLPLFYLEVVIGQFSSRSALHVWNICPLFSGLGWSMMIITGIMTMYYNVIIAWVVYYLVRSFTFDLPWGQCGNDWNTELCVDSSKFSNVSNSSFAWVNGSFVDLRNASVKWKMPAEEFWQNEVLQLSSGIDDMGTLRWELVLCLLASWMLVFACLCKGVKSLGKVVYVTATVPYVFLVILLIRGLTLDGAFDGIKYYITPDWPRLLEFKVWGEACLQIFYTLGPAWGGLITMASYNKFHNDGLRDSLVVCLTCCGTSFFAGFVIFSIVGFMAKQVNLPVSDVITSGPGLAFIAYPEALNKLPISPMWAIFFFLMLLTVGLDSQFGMFEMLVAGFVDLFPKFLQKRRTLFTAFMAFLWFLLGLPYVSHGGMYLFQIVDWYSASFSCMVIALFECICFCYFYGLPRLSYDIEMMNGSPPGLFFKICWYGVTPLILVVIIVFASFQMSEPTYGEYSYPSWAIAFGWCLAMLSIIPIPLYALVLVLREKGTLLQRLKKLTTPACGWGPALEKYSSTYKYRHQNQQEYLLDHKPT